MDFPRIGFAGFLGGFGKPLEKKTVSVFLMNSHEEGSQNFKIGHTHVANVSRWQTSVPVRALVH